MHNLIGTMIYAKTGTSVKKSDGSPFWITGWSRNNITSGLDAPIQLIYTGPSLLQGLFEYNDAPSEAELAIRSGASSSTACEVISSSYVVCNLLVNSFQFNYTGDPIYIPVFIDLRYRNGDSRYEKIA